MKKGDIVKVMETGNTFCSYHKWAERHNLDKWIFADGYRTEPEEGLSFLPKIWHLFKIVAIGVHSLPEEKKDEMFTSNEMLYGIEDMKTHQQYIISEDGIEFVKSGEAQLELQF